MVVLVVALVVWWRFGSSLIDSNRMAAAHEHAHDDHSMMQEHWALLSLMPGSNYATHVAARDGNWSDANTWSSGEVPGTGAIVHIPESVTVTYKGDDSHHLFMVRVDGVLEVKAPQGTDTKMVVDTFYTTPDSNLSIDAANRDDGTIEFEFRPFDIEEFKKQGAPGWGHKAKNLYSDGAVVTDTGAGTRRPGKHKKVSDGSGVLGRYHWDPEQLSLGMITHGGLRISGKQKLNKSTIARTAKTGDTSIQLTDLPQGWLPGDVIVITGTHYVGRDLVTGGYTGSQDEIRTITDVAGNLVSFDQPLTHNHDTPRDDLKAYAANLTRNVLLRSGDNLDLENLDADQAGSIASRLGHIMFMHNEKVSVRFAAFDDLGRTNKNDVADDFQRNGGDNLPSGRRNILFVGNKRLKNKLAAKRRPMKTPVDQVTNPRGRYAVHLHRTGAKKNNATALIEGCAVTGGPGWGYVSHDSRADFLNNVAYGVLGAAFVSETGNETGTWEGNIAINTYGADYNKPRFDRQGLFRYVNDNFDPTVLLEKNGSWKNHDFGHFGDGFWFQGKLIDIKNNISANSGLQGFFFMFRAPDQINVDPALLKEPLTVHSPHGIHPLAPGLNVFTGNRSIADRGGLAMIGTGGGRTNDERSVISDFVAWEVGQVGTHSQYYPGYTIKDSTFIASTSPDANPTDGVQFEKVQVDTVLANLTIEGFPHMYDLRKTWSPGARTVQGFNDPYEVIAAAQAKGQSNPLPLGYAHVIIDAGFTREQAAQPQYMDSTYRDEDLILTSDQLEIGRFDIKLDDESLKINLENKKIVYGSVRNDPVRPTMEEGHVLLLKGIKTDSIGEIPINYHNNNLVWHEDAVQYRLETQGYYQMASGSKGVILEEVFSDRYTAEKHVVRFVAELYPRWDLSKAIDQGKFDPQQHPQVYVPNFLLGE